MSFAVNVLDQILRFHRESCSHVIVHLKTSQQPSGVVLCTFSKNNLIANIYIIFVSFFQALYFYSRKQLLLSARLNHRNSVCPSVTRVGQSKTVQLQARITKCSPSAAWKAEKL